MTYSQQIAKHCREIHPEAVSDSDAVFAYQKDLQKTIELKKELNIPAAEEIALWFELFEVWNEVKAEELFKKNGGSNVNVSNNSIDSGSTHNRMVLVGD